MNEENRDFDFLNKVFIKGVPTSSWWTGFSRGGRLFLLAPRGHERDALSLYEPHRLRARFAKRLLQVALFLYRGLGGNTYQLQLRPDGPLAWLVGNWGLTVRGILLGNPEQLHRRIVCRMDDGSVVKIGLSQTACESIEREYKVLERYSGMPGIVEGYRFHGGPNFSLFQLPFLAEAKRDAPLELLRSWVGSETRYLGQLSDRVKDGFLLPEEMSRLEVATALEHGDFAPWNIRENSDGDLVAIDWEFGCEGVAGSDLVHYYFQVATKLEEHKGHQVLEVVAEKLSQITELGHWGWTPEGLLRFYILTTWNLTREERESYLRIMSL